MIEPLPSTDPCLQIPSPPPIPVIHDPDNEQVSHTASHAQPVGLQVITPEIIHDESEMMAREKETAQITNDEPSPNGDENTATPTAQNAAAPETTEYAVSNETGDTLIVQEADPPESVQRGQHTPESGTGKRTCEQLMTPVLNLVKINIKPGKRRMCTSYFRMYAQFSLWCKAILQPPARS